VYPEALADASVSAYEGIAGALAQALLAPYRYAQVIAQ